MHDRSPHAIVPSDPRNDVVVLGSSQYAPFAPAQPEQMNILKIVHSSLRGRYPVVITLALLFAAAGAVGGFMLGEPKYRSEALVRIQPRLPRILHESEQTVVTPMFASFVNTQANLLMQDRVITRAINSDKWKELGRTNTPRDVAAFRDSLRVNTNREAPELIAVSFTDRESAAAKNGLDQVLKAYEAIFGARQSDEVKNLQFSILEPEQRAQRDKIAKLREDIRKEVAEYGTEDLTELHNMKMQQFVGMERMISELELRIAEQAPAANSTSAEGGSADPTASTAQATAEQIAAVDRLMNEYVSRRREMDRELSSLQSRGFGAGHDAVKQVKSEIASLDKLINEYTTLWNTTQASRPLPGTPSGTIPAGEPIELTRARLTALQEQANTWRQEAVALGNKRLVIEGKQREIADAERRLEEVTRRLDEINIESKVEQTIGRIEVIYPDSAPSTPTVDPRKKYAILGGGAAGGAVVCLAFLIGLIDRRCRYSDEVDRTVDGKLLACLPVMDSNTAEMETMAAVHAVHRVRAQMQIVSPEFRTVAVTSANAGDGKTSVCLALGISFANVGRRTLIIDLDLVGHGLSSRMRMTAGSGVLDALNTSSPEGLARPSHVPMLDILPVGGGGDWSPARLRREEIQALLRNAAEIYDTVLIDTGPLLGSLEANFVCSSADAVLVIVGRGQSRTLVQRVLQNVRELNANLLGVVFNRAKDTDFRSSTVSASVRSVRDHPGASGNGKASRGRADVDPLADAVFVDALHADQHVRGDQEKPSHVA